MNIIAMRSTILLVLATSACAGANGQAPSQGPAVRDLSPVRWRATDTFGAISGVRGLPDGRVLINDAASHRLILLDSTLQQRSVVLDSSVSHAYGQRAGGLLRYLGDSSLFIDAGAVSALVIDASGRVVRQQAIPTRLVRNIMGENHPFLGYPDVDARGRVLLRAPVTGSFGRPGTIGQSTYDSMFIARLDFTTRAQDTIAILQIPRSGVSVTTAAGARSARVLMDPIPFTDGWAVLSGGSLAIVRARDYRLEVVAPDGSRQTFGRMPFPWRRVDDAEKQRLVDSATHMEAELAANAYYFQMVSWANANGMPYPAGFTIPPNVTFPDGLPAGWVLPPATPQRRSLTTEPPPPPPQPGPGEPREVVPVDQIADYWAPFAAGGVRADADNHVWIRTIGAPGAEQGETYDIVDTTGQIIARVRVPTGQAIAGFGVGHRVYFATQNAAGVHLSLAVWR